MISCRKSYSHECMLSASGCRPAVIFPMYLSQEVTGGSQAISAKPSSVDFPKYYKVRDCLAF